jgi:hypothetical protein
MKRFWLKKGLMMTVFFLVALLLFSGIVMVLWNAILPDVTGVKPVSFQQALGILVLSKILFGGFHSRGGWQRGTHTQWRNKLQEKLGNMTPEEKEKFKAEWRNRYGGRRCGMDREDR